MSADSEALTACLASGRALDGLAAECPLWEDNVRFIFSQERSDVEAALLALRRDLENDDEVEGQELSLRYFGSALEAALRAL